MGRKNTTETRAGYLLHFSFRPANTVIVHLQLTTAVSQLAAGAAIFEKELDLSLLHHPKPAPVYTSV